MRISDWVQTCALPISLAKWLVKEGDTVAAGDLLAEIETDKATMEFEAVDEGTIAKIVVPEGTDRVKVGEVIAVIAGEGEDAGAAAEAPKAAKEPVAKEGGETGAGQPAKEDAAPAPKPEAKAAPQAAPKADTGDRVKASPLARRLAEQKGVDLSSLTGSGPGGRIVKADIDSATGAPKKAVAPEAAPVATPAAAAATADTEIPHEAVKLSNMRKTIARRLTESKQQIPHIYLTVDIQIDALLKLRGELNESLKSRGVKLSVNDMLIKALAISLIEVPACNVSFAGDQLLKYSRADVSVAVSIPNGLITPLIDGADPQSMSPIAPEMKDLAEIG